MSVEIIVGDALTELRKMPSNSIDACMTSPPYWGLRDYGIDGQLGLEASLAEHIAAMVAVFEEVRRVLTPTGTCWINYGDCYATKPNGRSAADTKAAGTDDRTFRDKPFSTVQGTLKPKDLCMVPNRIAIALQDAGWWVRSEIVWGKPNPMPDSSGRYRPSMAHEKIWLLTKSAKSFYDSEAVRMPATSGVDPDNYAKANAWAAEGEARVQVRPNGSGGPRPDKQRSHSRRHQGLNDRWGGMTKAEQQANGRLLRNWEPDLSPIIPPEVWQIATAGFSEAHFATFPPALVTPCILAGCPKGGTVLDPFGGAGTTALVADRLQRNAVLIELNPAYAAMAQSRLDRDRGGLLDGMEVAA